MPKYAIEAEFLLPVYKHTIIEAPDFATACRQVIDADDWEGAEEDHDNARATEITAAVELPKNYSPDYAGSVVNLAACAIYWAGLPRLKIPAEFGDPDSIGRVKSRKRPHLSDRELAAIFAGLRLLQRVEGCPSTVDWDDDLLDVLTDGDRLDPLNDSEIDALCDRLNSGLGD